jgi:hypothetical protein
MMNHNENDDTSSNHHQMMSDEEARIWRRRFVSACRFDKRFPSFVSFSRNAIVVVRWFDVKTDRFLKADLLHLIFSLSQRFFLFLFCGLLSFMLSFIVVSFVFPFFLFIFRNLSRADAVSAVEDVCGDSEKLRYETFI